MSSMNMFSTLGGRLKLDRALVSHGLRLAFASWLAFVIAVMLDVHNPYWAAMPAWVITQATRGLILERGFFRLLGTLVGATFGLVLLQQFTSVPAQLLLLGLWITACASLTHVLRGVHAYGLLLCGITGAVVVLPSLVEPGHTLDLAIARIECTLIGVVIATLVTSWFTPWSERQAFYRRVRMLAGDAVDFAGAALRGEAADELERRLLAQIGEMEGSASLVSAASYDGYRRLNHVHALVYASIELMAASRALQARGAAGELPEQLSELAGHLRTATPGIQPHPQWSVLIDTALPRDKRLARALEQLMAAELALFTDPESSDARSFGRKAVYLAPHYDWSLALRNGVTCGLFTVATAAAALACGWKAGSLAAVGVSIFGMILGLAPLPQKLGPKMTIGVLTGVALATAYRVWLQPGLHGPLLICMSVLPLLFVGGIARVSPLFAIPALDGIMCFLLASQAGMPAAGLSEILNGSAALVAGSLLVTASVVIFPRQPARQARLVVRKACRDLERLVRRGGGSAADWRPKAARQILRLITHLGQAGQLGDKTPRNILSLINLGHAISQLKLLSQESDLHPADRELLTEVLAGLENLSRDQGELVARLERQLHTARTLESPGADDCAKAVERTLEALRPCLPLLDFANS